MTSSAIQPAASSEDASRILTGLEDGAWAVAGFMHLVRSGALTSAGPNVSSVEDAAAARTLAALGLVIEDGDRLQLAHGMGDLCASGILDTAAAATMSSLRQLANVAGILPTEDKAAWAMVDDATLLAQGKSSEFAGRMFATVGVPTLDGLAERFSHGGTFLDVGVGVGGLACAFSECLPAARVVGLDVLPRALDLARRTVADRGLTDRVELRLQAVEDLGDIEQFDLAWLPAPFIPEDVFAPRSRARKPRSPARRLVGGCRPVRRQSSRRRRNMLEDTPGGRNAARRRGRRDGAGRCRPRRLQSGAYTAPGTGALRCSPALAGS